uniref:Cullin domain-containing protein n=1 Tax=Panagrellus redivivus TaxID=6233 RepID=A0A7E4USA0_PANRE
MDNMVKTFDGIRVSSTDVFIQHWPAIKDMIKDFLSSGEKPTANEFMSLYNGVYKLLTSVKKRCDKCIDEGEVYNYLKQLFEDHVKTLRQKMEQLEGIDLLQWYGRNWDVYKSAIESVAYVSEKFYDYHYGGSIGDQIESLVVFNICVRVWQDELLSSSRLCNAIIALLIGELQNQDATESVTKLIFQSLVQGVKLPNTLPQSFVDQVQSRSNSTPCKVYYNTINYEEPAKDYILAALQQLQNNSVTDYVKAVQQRKSDNPNKELGPFHGTLDEIMTTGLLESCDVVLVNSDQFRGELDNLLKNKQTEVLNNVFSTFGNVKGANAVLAEYQKKLKN